jgi:hypothetical protein
MHEFTLGSGSLWWTEALEIPLWFDCFQRSQDRSQAQRGLWMARARIMLQKAGVQPHQYHAGNLVSAGVVGSILVTQDQHPRQVSQGPVATSSGPLLRSPRASWTSPVQVAFTALLAIAVVVAWCQAPLGPSRFSGPGTTLANSRTEGHSEGFNGAPRARLAALKLSEDSRFSILEETAWDSPEKLFTVELNVPDQQVGEGLKARLYAPVNSQIALSEAQRGKLTTPVIWTSRTFELTSLEQPGSNVVKLSLWLHGTATARKEPGAATAAITLACSLGNCDGVYPLSLSLVPHNTSQLASGPRSKLVTQVIYVDPGTTGHRLRFSLAVSLQGYSSSSKRAAIATLSRLMGNIRLPWDLSLAGSLVKDSSKLLVTPGGPQLTMAPFVPVNASWLASQGLSGQLGLQVTTTKDLLGSLSPPVAKPVSIWIASNPLTARALSVLEQLGVKEVVLPPGALRSLGSGSSRQVRTKTVYLTGTQGSVQAMSANSVISAQLQKASGQALSQDVLAQLAMAYFAEPFDPSLRGVVASVATPWHPSQSFLHALQHGLATSPVIDTVYLSNFFSQIRPEDSRFKLPSQMTSRSFLTRAQVLSFMKTIQAVCSSFQKQPDLSATLTKMLLATEQRGLGAAQIRLRLQDLHRAILAQTKMVSLAPGRTIILTARRAKIPITIVSKSKYPVIVVLDVRSPDLTFPHGHREKILVSRANMPAYIEVHALVSGDFSLQATLLSANGSLVLASARYTVRSSVTSLAGIVLTLVALAILAGWWISSMKRRRRLRALEKPA